MQFLQSPFAGPVLDNDMLLHWRGPTGSTIVDSTPPAAQLGLNRTLSSFGGGAGYTAVPSVVAPDGLAWRFNGGAYASDFATAGGVLGDHALLSNSPENDADGYAIQLAYDFSATATKSGVLEYAPETNANASTDSLRTPLRLAWDPANSRFEFGWRDAGNTRTYNLTSCPSKGVLGLDVTRRGGTVRLYHNGQLISTSSVAATINTNVGSSASARWILAGSVYSGAAYNTPGLLLDGIIERVTVWRRPLGDDGHLAKYGQIIQPWDDTALLESGTAKCVIKVEVGDAAVPTNWTDLSNFHGTDFVESVEVSESVDDVLSKARVSLFRRVGRFDDLSPLNVEQEVVGVLGVRKRLRIRRAMVPQGWAVQGWEFKTRFDGYIDSWSMSEGTIDVVCSDGLAPLQDAFISESRAYNYAAGIKSMEVVHEDLIDEYEPSLNRGATLIGYRGYLPGTPPKNYTVCGTAYTAWFQPSGFQVRFHDLSSGSVLSALSSLTDQIGYGVRWKHHPPWDGFRLTSFAPPRNKTLNHRQTTTLSLSRIVVECNEPHGLTIGSTATLSGKLDHNGGVSVSSIIDYYRFVGDVVDGSFISAPTTETAGTLTFDSHVRLKQEDLLEIGAVNSDVARIRNSCRVRINRNPEEVIERLLPNTVVDAADFITVNFEDPTVRLDHLDPDAQGITFTIKVDAADTGSVAQLAGVYTGLITGTRQITSTIPSSLSPPTGTYPAGGVTTTADGVTVPFPTITIQSESFAEVVSTATASVSAYGLLPMAIYEGSNLSIDTNSEAQLLADNVISDVAFPTYDVAFTSRVLPVMLHDVVKLPALTHGRWTAPVNVAITSVRERYASGACMGEYGGRFDYPSLGLAWVSNIMNTPSRPALAGVNSALVDTAAIQFRSDLGGMIRYQRDFGRDANSLRHDRTEVWISQTSKFVPNRSDRVVSIRGEGANITHDSTGAPLIPGRTYYGRVADRDIDGNLSNITGIDAAAGSIEDPLSTVVRFLGRTANAKAVTSAATTYGAVPDFPTFNSVGAFTIDNGSDSAGVSFDTYGNYTTSGADVERFRCPADGLYLAYCSTPIKSATKANQVGYGRFVRLSGSGAFLHASAPTSSATIPGAGSNTILTFSGIFSCASGEYLMPEFAGLGAANDIKLMGVTTASASYGRVQYSLVSQN